MPPDEARQDAQRQFGDVREVQRLCVRGALARARDRAPAHWGGWGQDVRYAWRMLRHAAVRGGGRRVDRAGIGANTAMFTLLDQVLLRQLPVSAPDRLVRVVTEGFHYGSTNGSGRELSYPLYAACAITSRSSSMLACCRSPRRSRPRPSAPR